MIYKKINFLFLITGVLIISFSHKAQSAEEKKVDEKSSETSKQVFKDRVKNIRSVAGEYDVFFNEHFGPYSVPFSLPNLKQKDQTPESILREAHKKGVPITVTVDSSTDTIISIDAEEVFRKPAESSDDSNLPPELEEYKDIFKKYNTPSKN